MIKKLFMVDMLKDTPETMAEQQRYCERNIEKCLEKKQNVLLRK